MNYADSVLVKRELRALEEALRVCVPNVVYAGASVGWSPQCGKNEWRLWMDIALADQYGRHGPQSKNYAACVAVEGYSETSLAACVQVRGEGALLSFGPVVRGEQAEATKRVDVAEVWESSV